MSQRPTRPLQQRRRLPASQLPRRPHQRSQPHQRRPRPRPRRQQHRRSPLTLCFVVSYVYNRPYDCVFGYYYRWLELGQCAFRQHCVDLPSRCHNTRVFFFHYRRVFDTPAFHTGMGWTGGFGDGWMRVCMYAKAYWRFLYQWDGHE